MCFCARLDNGGVKGWRGESIWRGMEEGITWCYIPKTSIVRRKHVVFIIRRLYLALTRMTSVNKLVTPFCNLPSALTGRQAKRSSSMKAKSLYSAIPTVVINSSFNRYPFCFSLLLKHRKRIVCRQRRYLYNTCTTQCA